MLMLLDYSPTTGRARRPKRNGRVAVWHDKSESINRCACRTSIRKSVRPADENCTNKNTNKGRLPMVGKEKWAAADFEST